MPFGNIVVPLPLSNPVHTECWTTSQPVSWRHESWSSLPNVLANNYCLSLV